MKFILWHQEMCRIITEYRDEVDGDANEIFAKYKVNNNITSKFLDYNTKRTGNISYFM